MLCSRTIRKSSIESADACLVAFCKQFQILQDTKTFPKCYVDRNGKRKQQKLHIQVCGSLKTQRNQGCQRLNVHTNQILAHTFSHGTLDSVVS